MSEDDANNSWWDKITYSWHNRRRLFLTPLCALLALGGFIIPWFGTSYVYPNASGWQMVLNEASKDLILLPGVMPAALIALWLVPAAALVLFGAGSARLLWMNQHWWRIWGWLLTGICLLIMTWFCFPLFPPPALQHFHDLQAGFWLTAGALLLSALGLLFPDPLWWVKETRRQPASEAQETNVPRRYLLSRAVNLGGMLVVVCAAGVDLSWLSRPHVTPHRVLSLGTFRVPSLQGMRALVWSPDNASLLECLSGVLRSWKIATGQVTRTYLSPSLSGMNILEGTRKGFTSIALSPDGRWLAATKNYEGVVLWEAASGRFVNRFTRQNPISVVDEFYGGVTWSPDGRLLTTSMYIPDGQTVLFILRASDLRQQVMLQPLSDIAQTAVWSPDGRMLAIATGFIASTAEVWDVSRGKKIWTYQPPSFTVTLNEEGEIKTDRTRMQVADVAWAPDSQRLAISLSSGIPGIGSGDQETPVLIWNVVENRMVGSCQGHWGGAYGLTWSPDGTRIAAAGEDWTVQVWNAQTQKRLLVYQGHHNVVWSVAWSPDGAYIASGSEDKTIQVWQAPRLS